MLGTSIGYDKDENDSRWNFSLVKKRPYIVVGAFVIGMLLTPPDVISQTLLAVPMWLLFEVGVFFSRRYDSAKGKTTRDRSDDIDDPGAKGA